MNKLLKRFAKSEDGVTALEYGLIAGVIVIAVAATVPAIGGSVKDLFTSVETMVGGAATAAKAAAASG
ncbi:Flp family type IVb pilin [Paraburkholderia tagetis]|uniref:Flp family type IVb pilin n=1 Tax=Paraburkholderia tagetis TaxID=2913261 RepID=A0A9X1RS22_9BURK|nr:Flp family type IVb pilin [Paraburkholderia tagetis]MCG5073939.1 Flp family type IVb pilin [Paraburkholderia tagetis]